MTPKRATTAGELVSIAERLAHAVNQLEFAEPITHVYNPLEYAWETHRQYLERYGNGQRELLFLGMNPGPFGMAQTGVPFGDVGCVRDFLGIVGEVKRPAREHPQRPVQGFRCSRSEVSGSRLWGWVAERWGNAESFFERAFVLNYCPLIFLEAPVKNRTPDKLPKPERELLFAACDTALYETIGYFKPRFVIGIGAFARDRAAAVVARDRALSETVTVGTMLHPSPANPRANRNWAGEVEAQLAELGIPIP